MGSDGKGKKLGSFKIASMIARTDGLRGFYIGGLMTACRDGISSGIFFWGCMLIVALSAIRLWTGLTLAVILSDFVFRRLLRGQEPFKAAPVVAENRGQVLAIESEILVGGKINKAEVGRIFFAGGVAGSLSAVVPYP